MTNECNTHLKSLDILQINDIWKIPNQNLQILQNSLERHFEFHPLNFKRFFTNYFSVLADEVVTVAVSQPKMKTLLVPGIL